MTRSKRWEMRAEARSPDQRQIAKPGWEASGRDDGALVGEVNIAVIEAACRPIREWLIAAGYPVAEETKH